MKRCWLAPIIIWLLAGYALAATPPIVVDMDAYVSAAPASAEQTIPALASYLTAPYHNQHDQAHAIYRWVAGEISYNVAARISGRYGDNGAEAVLKRRTALCEGYANLFQRLTESAGFKCEKIIGISKNDAFAAGGTANKNHAWNAIRIDGAWQLVDCTLGAGFINERGNFEHSVSDYDFCTPPDQFIFDHFPSEAKWQLLQPSFTRTQFDALPMVTPCYFQDGIGGANLSQRVLQAEKSLQMTLTVPNGIILIASVYQDERKLPAEYAFTQRIGQQRVISIAFPQAGHYLLRVFAKHVDDTGGYLQLLEYEIIASGGGVAQAFPKTYGAFQQLGAVVHTPLTRILSIGKPVTFTLDVPDADEVVVTMSESWIPLHRTGQQFTGTITPVAGPLLIAAKRSGNSRFSVLLEYLVQ